MRVALVHYWLVGDRGGEKVLKALYEMYPTATIFTHVFDRAAVNPIFQNADVRTSMVQTLPFARSKYQLYLPFMPMALEGLDLQGYDLVISTESGPAKGVIPAPQARHFCYVHSPMRYIWNMYAESMRRSNIAVRTLFPAISNYLRTWDVASAARVDAFAANSHAVKARIARYWRRDAEVIAPPVAVQDFPVTPQHEGFYLYVSELVDYKRADLVVDAFTASGRPLVVIGDGPQMKALRARAGANVKLLGRVDFASLRAHYAACRAFVFAAEEDFGIVPVEAMACGKPVIAFGKGGALDTVRPGVSGLLFPDQTPQALNAAIAAFEDNAGAFDPHAIRAHAETFDVPVFKAKMAAALDRLMGA
jgi:glycosyltransferase involved in cell wall biosynthesis